MYLSVKKSQSLFPHLLIDSFTHPRSKLFISLVATYTFTLRLHTDLGNVRSQDIPSGGIITLADSDVSTCGSKAAACGLLASLAAASTRGKSFL